MVKQILENIDFGKIPPQAIDLEQSVLGMLMTDNRAIIESIDIIKPEIFYKDEHQKICQAIIELERDQKKIDILTVTEQLRKNKTLDEVGGPLYVTQLIDKSTTIYHFSDHLKLIIDKYKLRELIRISSDIQSSAYDSSVDVQDVIDYAEKEFTALSTNVLTDKTITIMNSINEVVYDLEKINTNNLSLTGIPSGITGLDRLINGWQESDLIIIAARPSMGKTAFSLKFGYFSSISKFPTAVFSMEMSHKQLSARLFAASMGVEPQVLRSKIDDSMWIRVTNFMNKFYEVPLYIDDTPALKLYVLRAKIRRLVRKYGIKLVIIDYLQLMAGDSKSQNRENEISEISRGLKGIAKELNILIIALSQLNRSVESRGGFKRPMLSDLRESGAIEQDADIVIFINRPFKYGYKNYDDHNETPTKITRDDGLFEVAELIVAKHRNGRVDTIKVIHNEAMTYIDDYIPEKDIAYRDYSEPTTEF